MSPILDNEARYGLRSGHHRGRGHAIYVREASRRPCPGVAPSESREVAVTNEASATPRPGLRRQLGFLGTLALSIGIMAPTGALSANGIPVAGLVGRGVP